MNPVALQQCSASERAACNCAKIGATEPEPKIGQDEVKEEEEEEENPGRSQQEQVPAGVSHDSTTALQIMCRKLGTPVTSKDSSSIPQPHSAPATTVTLPVSPSSSVSVRPDSKFQALSDTVMVSVLTHAAGGGGGAAAAAAAVAASEAAFTFGHAQPLLRQRSVPNPVPSEAAHMMGFYGGAQQQLGSELGTGTVAAVAAMSRAPFALETAGGGAAARGLSQQQQQAASALLTVSSTSPALLRSGSLGRCAPSRTDPASGDLAKWPWEYKSALETQTSSSGGGGGVSDHSLTQESSYSSDTAGRPSPSLQRQPSSIDQRELPVVCLRAFT